MPMTKAKPPEKILMVDDEVQILDSFRRELRGKVNLDTAVGGGEALEAIVQKGPYAVVVSDFKMPGMNGIDFLSKVRQASPETVRMMLTGYADLDNTIEAVNQGNIFRFLTKPCSSENLMRSLVDGIRQYRLVRAEKDLLDQTLRGSVKVLTDLLALVKPHALGRANRISRYVKEIAQSIGVEDQWEIESASELSQIGCITLPDELVRKVSLGGPLNQKEKRVFNQHPQTGAEMVANIPRMEEVAKIIAYQEKNYDGSGVPEDDVSQDDIPLGSRIIKLLLDFDALVSRGDSKGIALNKLKRTPSQYDPALITTFDMVLGEEAKYDVRKVKILDLKEGMILAEDIVAASEKKRLLAKGQELSKTLIMSVRSYHRVAVVKEPLKVMVPLER
jgi:response regulator RpfG family c-di-GMP phosphodiesterase